MWFVGMEARRELTRSGNSRVAMRSLYCEVVNLWLVILIVWGWCCGDGGKNVKSRDGLLTRGWEVVLVKRRCVACSRTKDCLCGSAIGEVLC
jgi:hypothetical protein